MPANIAAGGVATTQPMSMPRTGSTGLRPTKPGAGQSTRSTQRIVLPTPPGARTDNTRSLAAAIPAGKINLPAGMILRCMPPEVLSSDVSELERTGAAATEVGVPMSMILSQLPSGKVEMTVQELVPHIPPGFLKPVEEISSHLQSVVSLPLMDVVMRIPPDLLALRPDQKEVDASVINMADPFTEEILREQAEAARRQAGANIIEESQAPQEEFVPSAGAGTRSVAPPRRPAVEPLSPSRTAATTLAAPIIPTARATPPGLAPQRPSGPPSTPPLPPAATAPALPPPVARTPTGQIPTPVRMSAPLPPRQPPAQPPSATIGAPVPPVPRNTGPIPAPPPPRHTTNLPTAARRTGTLASLSQSLTGAARAAAAAAAASGATAAGLIIEREEAKEPAAPPVVPSEPEAEAQASEAEPVAEDSAAPAPDANKDDLQRLAALAMAQLGEAEEPIEPPVDKPVPVTSFSPLNERRTQPVTVLPGTAATEPPPVEATPEPKPTPEPAPEPEASEPEPVEEPIRAPEPIAAFVPEPIRAPEPIRVTEPFADAPEPIRAPEPVAAAPEPIRTAPEPIRAPAPEPAFEDPTHGHGVDGSASAVAFNLNTCTAEDLLHHIPGVTPVLAAAVIAHRNKIGTYAKIEDLLGVPGMTGEAYTGLTGEQPPATKPPMSVNELLGFPVLQHVTLKDVTDRIACWPDVTGCLLSQSSGLSLVGTTPAGLEKEAVVAFAPRMFDTLNKSYAEITGEETDVLIIPSSGTSFHLFRSKDLYLIIMTRVPLMPERHVKVARMVLTGLANRKD